jgi:hypothetical protein
MGSFWEKYLLGVTVPLSVALVFWLSKKGYEAIGKKPDVAFSWAINIFTWFWDLASAYSMVVAGVQIGLHPRTERAIWQWFGLGAIVICRVYVSLQKNRSVVLDEYLEAKSTFDLAPELHDRLLILRQVIFWRTGWFQSKYAAYMIVSTFVWLWIAMLFALFVYR